MEKNLLSSEFERIKKRDNRHVKVLAFGYILVTLFGFLALIFLLNSLQDRYEEKFGQFEVKTTALSKKTQKDIAKLVNKIEINDSTYKEIDDALKNSDLKFKDEINKLWRSAYVKARDNENTLKDLTKSIANYNESLSLINDNLSQVTKDLNITKSTSETNSSIIESLSTNLTTLKDQINSMSSSIEQAITYINNPESQWNVNKGKLNTLSETLQTMETRLETLEKNISSKTQEIRGETQNVDSINDQRVQPAKSNNSIQPTQKPRG